MTPELIQLLGNTGSIGLMVFLLYFFRDYLNKVTADGNLQQKYNMDRVDRIYTEHRSEVRVIVDGFTQRLDGFTRQMDSIVGVVEKQTAKLDSLGKVIEDLSYEVTKQNDILVKTSPPPANNRENV